MPIIYECFQARSKITELKTLNGKSVVLSTEHHGMKQFSASECEIELNMTHKHLNYETSVIAFSSNAQLLALGQNKNIYIIHMPTRKLIATIHLHDESISAISFDISSTYLIVGTLSSRILQYKYNSGSILSRLYSFEKTANKENPVTAFDFYQNSLACGNKDGAIAIINLHNRANNVLLTHKRARVNALCFIDTNTLISGHSDGSVHKDTLNDDSVSTQITTPFHTISQIIAIPDTHYSILSVETNFLALLDTKLLKIADSKYMEFEDTIHKITLVNDAILFVALQNNKIFKVELPSAKKLNSLILHNSIEEAFAFAKKNPMIQTSDTYKKLEEHYEKTYMDAVQALINQNKNLAIQLLFLFKNIPSKKENISLLFKSFENYHRFKGVYFEKKYALAYAISSKFPALEHTHEFRQMEKIWKEAFVNAQRHILLKKPDDAKALLNEYITVISKRPIIKLILNNNSAFMEFLKAIEEKEFAKVAGLAKENDSFHKIPSYKALENSTESKLQEIESFIKKGDIQTAKISLQELTEMPYIEKKLEQLHQGCFYALVLQQAYDNDDFKSCYEILDSHPFLYSSELGIMLEKYWIKLMKKCEDYALRGDIKNIKICLGELIDISSRKEKIGDLLRVSFHVKIKMLLSKKSFKNAENIIYSYIDIFGVDTEVHTIMKSFEKISLHKLAITQNQTQRPPRDHWIYSKIIKE